MSPTRNKRQLEVRIIKGEGSDPEIYEMPLNNQEGKINLFVFRGSRATRTEKYIQELVEISTKVTNSSCIALNLGDDDKFEVYEVEIPTRYERTPVI